MKIGVRIRLLKDDDGKELSELRKDAYSATYGDKIDLKQLQWNKSLNHALNLGLFLDSRLVSAYRLDGAVNQQWIGFALQSEASQLNLEPPIVIGCRACTMPELQNRGLHFFLRLIAIKILQSQNLGILASTFESQNPWNQSLSQMGYELHDTKALWTDFIQSLSAPVIGVLNLKKSGAKAVDYLEQRLAFRDFELVGVDLDQEQIKFWRANFK